MTFSAERSLATHMDRWHHLLGMGEWVITWELLTGPIDRQDSTANNHYYVRRNGRRESHIKFSRSIRTDAQAERAVIHELLHVLDHGIGNDLHKFIYRLEPKLRMVRRRTEARK